MSRSTIPRLQGSCRTLEQVAYPCKLIACRRRVPPLRPTSGADRKACRSQKLGTIRLKFTLLRWEDYNPRTQACRDGVILSLGRSGQIFQKVYTKAHELIVKIKDDRAVVAGSDSS